MDKAIIYFSIEDKLWSEEEFESAFLKMPEKIAKKIKTYNDQSTQQLKLKGKLQLLSLIEDFNSPLSLDQLRFTNSNRPYFHSGFDFNMAHSGDIVVCSGLKNGRIGIDIEKIKPLDVNLYENYFSSEEWKVIKGSENYLSTFYKLWTRKEALAKAIGIGVIEDFPKLEVLNNRVEIEDLPYYLHELIISEGYIANMAVSLKTVSCEIKNFNQKTKNYSA